MTRSHSLNIVLRFGILGLLLLALGGCGSDLRLYATRIRAPFGLAYFPGSSDLFASMNQRDDLGARTPGIGSRET